jgi:hypothetical protein
MRKCVFEATINGRDSDVRCARAGYGSTPALRDPTQLSPGKSRRSRRIPTRGRPCVTAEHDCSVRQRASCPTGKLRPRLAPAEVVCSPPGMLSSRGLSGTRAGPSRAQLRHARGRGTVQDTGWVFSPQFSIRRGAADPIPYVCRELPGRLRNKKAGSGKCPIRLLVEVRGVEPLSEYRSHPSSTCIFCCSFLLVRSTASRRPLTNQSRESRLPYRDARISQPEFASPVDPAQAGLINRRGPARTLKVLRPPAQSYRLRLLVFSEDLRGI